MTPKYPELTPYQFASNIPILTIDQDGLESMIPEEESRYEREREDLEREELHRNLGRESEESIRERERINREIKTDPVGWSVRTFRVLEELFKEDAYQFRVREAINLGNRVHYDQLNGGTGIGLPTELSTRYPSTQFRFTPGGAKGADVEVVGGLHPSLYPGSTWTPGRNFWDFKPATPSGARTFNRDIRISKLPLNTQLLEYDPSTGALK